jgi:hypothetical protein
VLRDGIRDPLTTLVLQVNSLFHSARYKVQAAAQEQYRYHTVDQLKVILKFILYLAAAAVLFVV